MMQASLLPAEVNDVFARVRAAGDREVKTRILSELRLYELDVNLLRDARSFLDRGTLPNTWTSATDKLGFPVYELRDRVGAAWRGALIFHRNEPATQCEGVPAEAADPWMVYAGAHGAFHNAVVKNMKNLDDTGNLRPSELDLRIREVEDADIEDCEGRAKLLHAVLDAMARALETHRDIRVETDARLPKFTLSVSITDVPAEGWDAEDAHGYGDVVTLSLTLDSSDQLALKWIIETCVPFLQPDPTQVEPVYTGTLTLAILLTRAKLTQLLAEPRPTSYRPRSDFPPPPTVLHYTDRFSLTRAFVFGRAVRAVCGDWWVPVGDAFTHSDLPICAECNAELPVAQALKNLLRGG